MYWGSFSSHDDLIPFDFYLPLISYQVILDSDFFNRFKISNGWLNDSIINWTKNQFRFYVFYPARVNLPSGASLDDILCFPDVFAWTAISECASLEEGSERNEAYALAKTFVQDGLFTSKYVSIIFFLKI